MEFSKTPKLAESNRDRLRREQSCYRRNVLQLKDHGSFYAQLEARSESFRREGATALFAGCFSKFALAHRVAGSPTAVPMNLCSFEIIAFTLECLRADAGERIELGSLEQFVDILRDGVQADRRQALLSVDLSFKTHRSELTSLFQKWPQIG